MTEDLREPFQYFVGLAQELGRRYRTINDLFFGPPEVLAAMKSTAPGFFRELLDVYREAILFGMARLVDPEKDRKGKPNLSVRRFIAELDRRGMANEEMRSRAKAMETITKNKSLADFRNRWLAHSDENSAIEQESFEIPDWADVKQFLDDLDALTREIGNALGINVTRALSARKTPLHAKHFTEYLIRASSQPIEPSAFTKMTETRTNGR